MTLSSQTPIAAIATAPGRGGIGIVRLSGRSLAPIVDTLFGQALTPRHAHLLPFSSDDGQIIDEGIVLFFPAPHSYTGEDVLELQGHGGPAVLKRVLDRCLAAGQSAGMRLAQPGEFTQRAFLNNRLDLAQAEAVADLIDASSEAAARGAMASLTGEFSKQVSALSDRIVHLRMLVEATLDFPEEEIDFLEKYQARSTLDALIEANQQLINTSRQGVILREGLHVVLAGVPNVGKSSLLNALAGDDIAIVTPIAGTTRDRVIQNIHIDGVPLHIVDTAGLRETADEVERIGIERTWKEIERADLIIHMRDIRDQGEDAGRAILERLPARTPVLNVINKIDLTPGLSNAGSNAEQVAGAGQVAGVAQGADAEQVAGVGRVVGTEQVEGQGLGVEQGARQGALLAALPLLHISAKTGQGLNELRTEILKVAGWNPAIESPWLARERHLHALFAAADHLQIAHDHASQDDRVLDLFAEELRLAHVSLTEITGQFTSDDLLGEIFSSFCIGK